jgi:adenosyl cobinamide kinase/adenosyl cobinamide phosphate guanylyltransferase
MEIFNNFKIALVTGGCKSGKSNHALDLALQVSSHPHKQKVFIATCIPADQELETRVKAHQDTRGPGWRTIEAPYDMPEAIITHGHAATVMVVDCLTMWINNLLWGPGPTNDLDAAFENLDDALSKSVCPVILVSNEVGCGIVPATALGRKFRDLAGNLNQQVARRADSVVWCVAGIAVSIK